MAEIKCLCYFSKAQVGGVETPLLIGSWSYKCDTGRPDQPLWMQSACGQGGISKNRRSFVKVGHLRATMHLRMRCECTIPRHDHAYPFSWISRWALLSETGRHSHFTLTAVAIETAQRHLSADVVCNFLYCVQKSPVSMDTLQNNENTRALKISGCDANDTRKNEKMCKVFLSQIKSAWAMSYSPVLEFLFFVFVSYLMNDLRHWQLVCIWVQLLL